MKSRSLYAAFDTFPAPKGAATHIKHMAKTLFDHCGSGTLYALGGEGLPAYQQEGHIEIVRFSERVPNLLQRALTFSQHLSHLLAERGQDFEICHYRDPWSAYPILNYREMHKKHFLTVYEVNALPSLELPYAFPHIAPETLAKVRAQEALCLELSDRIVTPSKVTADYLASLGVEAAKITHLPNGADIQQKPTKPAEAPEQYLIYFGAIQRWQGVEDILRAFTILADFEDLQLVLCLAKHNRTAKGLRKLAQRQGIDDKITWRFGLDQDELLAWLAHAELSLAPLSNCSRNTEQGCCPLKILESMAAGVPVVSTDLPVVRELITDGLHGRLVRPERALDLAIAIRSLLDEPEERRRMGRLARQRAEEHFDWKDICGRLAELYQGQP